MTGHAHKNSNKRAAVHALLCVDTKMSPRVAGTPTIWIKRREKAKRDNGDIQNDFVNLHSCGVSIIVIMGKSYAAFS